MIDGLQAIGSSRSASAPPRCRRRPRAGVYCSRPAFGRRPGSRYGAAAKALPPELAGRLLDSGGELWNMYGPTETTIWSSCARLAPVRSRLPSAARPPTRSFMFWIDTTNRYRSVLPGQLHIGGDGVARGYYRRPQLDRREVRRQPIYCRAHVPHGRFGALATERHARNPRAHRSSGQTSRLSHRVGRNRGSIAAKGDGLPRQRSSCAKIHRARRAWWRTNDAAGEDARSPAELRALLAAEIAGVYAADGLGAPRCPAAVAER